VWRFFLTLIFQWAIIVLERAMLVLVFEQENLDPNLDPDQTGRPDHKPKPGQLLKRQHVVNLFALSA
jgi:hypothetical protein